MTWSSTVCMGLCFIFFLLNLSTPIPYTHSYALQLKGTSTSLFCSVFVEYPPSSHNTYTHLLIPSYDAGKHLFQDLTLELQFQCHPQGALPDVSSRIVYSFPGAYNLSCARAVVYPVRASVVYRQKMLISIFTRFLRIMS